MFIHKIISRYRTSIERKLTLILILTVSIPLILAMYISNRSFLNEIQNSYIVFNTSILDNVQERLDEYYNQLVNISMYFYYDKELLQEGSSNRMGEVNSYNDIMKKLLYVYSQRQETNSVLYYNGSSEELFVVNKAQNRSFLHAVDIQEMVWYKKAESNKNILFTEPTHILDSFNKKYEINSKEPVISFYYSFNGMNRTINSICVNYNLNNIQVICDSSLAYENENVIYMNETGELIYSKFDCTNEYTKELFDLISEYPQNQGAFQYKPTNLPNENMVVVFQKSERNGHITIKSIPKKTLKKHASESAFKGSYILILAVIGMIPIEFYIAKKITNPVLNMIKKMVSDSESNPYVIIDSDSLDELGLMHDSFEQMISQMNNLLNEQYRLKTLYKTTQLKALIAQINPHFLYNILQSIGGYCLEHGLSEIYTITNSLGKIFRYSIKGDSIVELSQELQNINDYLILQKFRYEDKLNYQINVPDEMLKLKIPKIILQPLVENAIIHGIERKEGAGEVVISCCEEGENIIFVVKDDGMGIKQSKLEEIIKGFSSVREAILSKDQIIEEGSENAQQDSMGLLNVYQRLLLTYGAAFSMTLDSIEGLGTVCTITIDGRDLHV